MYWTYLLENQNDKSWYIGYTSNLKKRLTEHQNGYGAQTTKNKLRGNLSRGDATKNKQNWMLIYYEGYKNKKDAEGRERFLKSGSGRKFLKKQLVNYLGT